MREKGSEPDVRILRAGVERETVERPTDEYPNVAREQSKQGRPETEGALAALIHRLLEPAARGSRQGDHECDDVEARLQAAPDRVAELRHGPDSLSDA